MFNIDKDTLNAAVRDRTLILLTAAAVLMGLFIIASGFINIRPTDIQVPVRFSAYGVTNLYRDKWYYLLSFILAGGLLVFMHPLISLKLWQEKSRDYAVGFAAVTVVLAIIGILISSAVFRIVQISI